MPSEETLGKRLDDVWGELDFGGVWYNRKQRRVAEEMVAKFRSPDPTATWSDRRTAPG
ncbi:hypothetical protein ACWDR9_37260 [Streptosporangium sandarakinum]